MKIIWSGSKWTKAVRSPTPRPRFVHSNPDFVPSHICLTSSHCFLPNQGVGVWLCVFLSSVTLCILVSVCLSACDCEYVSVCVCVPMCLSVTVYLCVCVYLSVCLVLEILLRRDVFLPLSGPCFHTSLCYCIQNLSESTDYISRL